MKKVISMLLTVAIACTLSVATFAADDTPGTTTNTQNIAPYIDVVGTSNNISIGAGELYLVDTGSNVVAGVYNHLEPDTEYNFRVFYNNTGSPIVGDNTQVVNGGGVELNGSMLDGGTARLRTVRGSSYISSARIRTIGRGDSARYEVQLTTRAYYGTKMNDVEYSLSVTGSTHPAGTFVDSIQYFEVGHMTISDAETDVGEDGTIVISNDYPVILKEQFTDIAKSANYKTVTFEGEDGGWRYTGRVSGMGDSNFYYTYDVIPELMNRFPDQDFKFLTFRAGVSFPSNGEMRIDVSDVYDTYETMHVYMYRNGTLTEVNTDYDIVDEEIVFRTNYLGAFVITDIPITDSDLLGVEELPIDTEPIEPPSTENPSTGASRALSVGVTLGLVSLAAAGAVSRKKK